MGNTRLIFDRRGKAKKDAGAVADVEVCVTLPGGRRVYQIIDRAKPGEYEPGRKEYAEAVAKAESLLGAMRLLGEELTPESVSARLGLKTRARRTSPGKAAAAIRDKEAGKGLGGDFLTFFRARIETAGYALSSQLSRRMVADHLERSGAIRTFADLTAANLIAFDSYLHERGISQVTIGTYHAMLKPAVREAYERGIISENPYNRVHFSRGRSPERRALTEAELERVRTVRLRPEAEKSRQLFLFCAGTGLSFSDARRFDFATQTEERGGRHYIDGARVKTGTNYYTPILPIAMEALKACGMKLPRIPYESYCRHLHWMEKAIGLRYPLTSHVARHTFATIALSKGAPIESISRMLGHTSIAVTQIYAKVLRDNIVAATDLLV